MIVTTFNRNHFLRIIDFISDESFRQVIAMELSVQPGVPDKEQHDAT